VEKDYLYLKYDITVVEQYRQNRQYHYAQKNGDNTNCSRVTKWYPPNIESWLYP